MPASPRLQQYVADLPEVLLDTPADELSSQVNYFSPIRRVVQDVDGNPTQPTHAVTPDALVCPASGTSPCLHREDKSWAVFDAYAPEILALAQYVEAFRVENQ